MHAAVEACEKATTDAMFKNWKTTLAGVGAGALNLFAQGMNWKSVLMSAGLAALGAFAKDSNVTGGTVRQ